MAGKRIYLFLLIPLVLAVFAVADYGFFFQAAVPGSCILILFVLLRRQLSDTPDTWYIVAALLFSIVGDWFLSNKGDSFIRFSSGIGLYLVAHVGYLWFALKNGRIHLGFTAVILAGFLLFFFISLFPAIDDTVLLIAVLFYLLISCLSLGAAFGIRLAPAVKWSYFLGIAFILFSDTIIALKEFIGYDDLNFLISPTYYAAHISVTFALIRRMLFLGNHITHSKYKIMRKILTIVLAVLLFSCGAKYSSSDFEIGRIDVGTAYEVAISGNYAYVGNNKGVVIIDISEPENPKKEEILKTDDAVFAILIEGNHLFIGSGGASNLTVYDIKNPAEPVFLSSLTIDGVIVGMSKNGNNIFIATQNGYLMVVDASDLTDMNLVKSLNCNGQGTGLIFHQAYIYYANALKGLQIIDIGNIENPIISETISGTIGAWDVFIQDENLYLAKHHNGFNVLSLDNSAAPIQVFSNNNGGEAYGICCKDVYLYVADLQQGIEIWDNSDPKNPSLIETLSEYVPHDIAARDDLIYLADQDRGFVIIRY